MTNLHNLSESDPTGHSADVVFVHGLNGHHIKTWQNYNKTEAYWPKWLAKDFPLYGIWSLEYVINSTDWRGPTMPLVDRATNVLSRITQKGIGKRPVVFITHSMGGLLVKQVLRNALDFGNEQQRKLPQNTVGIIFLSTPHFGSDLASWVEYFRLIYRSSASVNELRAHNVHLNNLNLQFREYVQQRNVAVRVYYETYPTRGVLVVNATSADPGLPKVVPVPMDGDHNSICIITNREEMLYEEVCDFIDELSPILRKKIIFPKS